MAKPSGCAVLGGRRSDAQALLQLPDDRIRAVEHAVGKLLHDTLRLVGAQLARPACAYSSQVNVHPCGPRWHRIHTPNRASVPARESRRGSFAGAIGRFLLPQYPLMRFCSASKQSWQEALWQDRSSFATINRVKSLAHRGSLPEVEAGARQDGQPFWQARIISE